MEKICRVFPANMESYPDMLAFVSACAADCGISKARLLKLELGFEEAAVNIIHYAYPDNVQGKIWIQVWSTPTKFFLELSNSGKCFNPLTRPTPQKQSTLPLEEISIGGWGIHFMRTSFDELSYQNRPIEGKPGNFLTMSLYLQELPPT